MSAPCLACGDRIALDGYCAGCALLAGGHVATAERFADRLGRGHIGYTVFVLAALLLYSIGTQPEQFGLGRAAPPDASVEAPDLSPVIPRSDWSLAAIALGAVVLAALCRGLMSAGAPSILGRLMVWLALITAWVFSGFLGFRAAQACQLAFREAASQAVAATAASDRLDREVDSLRYAYWERARQRSKPIADLPAVDLLGRLAERDSDFDAALARLENERKKPEKQFETVDALRWQSGLLFASCLAAMASVIALLFLVAAEQAWEVARPRSNEAVEALAVD